MDDNSWELGRRVSYFNGTLKKLRIEKGLLQKDVAKGVGVSEQTVSHLETMRIKPSKELAEKLAKFFKVKPTDIFPEFLDILSEKIPKKEIKYAKLDALALEDFTQKQLLLQEKYSNPEEAYREQEIHDRIEKALDKLTDRERRIITLHYGLRGEVPHSIKEISDLFDLTHQRIREIEAKALHKIRMMGETKEIKEIANIDLLEGE